MTSRKTLLAASAALLLLFAAGCGSMNDIYGTNNQQNYPTDIRGTVSSVDTSTRSIYLTNTSGYNSMLSSGGTGSDVRVYYDNNTRVVYNGQSYRPQDLDRGDQVDVRVTQSGNKLLADNIDVTYNSTTASSTYPGSTPYPNGTYSQTITGTVRSVDTSGRMIEIDRGYGSSTWINYDTNTSVVFNGRTYMPQDLERGDQVSITATDSGGGRLIANNISVTRSVSGTNGTATNYATVRGTVRYVDTSSHTIELEQTSWMSGFNGNTSSNVMVVQYDSNTQVDVSGRLYPVSGLERGDVIDAQVSSLSNTSWLANRITLVRNVRQ